MPVTLTRVKEDHVYRRRICTVCGVRMTTVEMYSKGNLDMPISEPIRKKKK
jgi:transcriptional regulator NrdR family protein